VSRPSRDADRGRGSACARSFNRPTPSRRMVKIGDKEYTTDQSLNLLTGVAQVGSAATMLGAPTNYQVRPVPRRFISVAPLRSALR
jgi:hypothetical protein